MDKYRYVREMYFDILLKSRPGYDFKRINDLDFTRHIAPFVMPCDPAKSGDLEPIGRLPKPEKQA